VTERTVSRRTLFAAALVLPMGACTPIADQFSSLFASKPKYTLSPRGDRLVRWLQNGGRDNMMAPEVMGMYGITNEGRDIPVKQFAEDGRDGRYVVSLVNIRKVHEFVFHRRQGEVLVFHHCDTSFGRIGSIRYPRNGKPVTVTDNAFADNDFQQQLAFWFDRLPGR